MAKNWDADFETGDELTADEWDSHVTDQKNHSGRHESGGSDEVDHDSLLNYVSNEHVDHSTVTITAGSGLTGGGDISQDQTLNAQSVESVTADTTLNEVDIALVDASGGAVTVTLPAPSTDIRANIKKTDSSNNTVTIATPNAETIDGESNRTIDAQYISRTIVSDGNNYFIV